MISRVHIAAAVGSSLSLVLLVGATGGRSLTDARVDTLEARISVLESRLSATSAAQGGQASTVKAPFTVTDAAGIPIFTVRSEPRGIVVSDANGTILVAASALPTSGFVKVVNTQRDRAALIAADAQTARLVLRDGETSDRATISVSPNGRPTLTLNGDSHKPIVELATQVSSGGGGELSLSDGKGTGIVYASALSDGGIVKVINSERNRVAVMGIQAARAALSIRDGVDASSDRGVFDLSSDGKMTVGTFSASHTKVFEVAQEAAGGGRINLSDASGKTNVALGALPIGGYFKAQTPDAGRVAILGTETGTALVTLRDGAKTPRATLALTGDGKPTLALFNQSHSDIVSLTEGSAGAGVLQLFDASGATMVEAGTVAGGRGTVRVGPYFSCIGQMPPLVPDCIRGNKEQKK